MRGYVEYLEECEYSGIQPTNAAWRNYILKKINVETSEDTEETAEDKTDD